MQYSMADALPKIKNLLAENRLSIFAGSGISVSSGLPAWDGFIDQYIKICEELNDSIDDPDLKFDEIIADAKTAKKQDLIATATALKDKVKICTEHGINTDYVDDELNSLFYKAIPNNYHKFIVSTDYRHIITTNYDNLLEKAAKDLGYKSLLTRSYSYTEQNKISMAIYSGYTSIIHAHGKISGLNLDQFVLTNDDYLAIMKHNPGFRLIINSIFLTTSVLFVGYGGSDPHFEDIISDLNATLKWNDGNKGGDALPRCFIMLRKDKVTPIRKFLSDKHRVDIITFDDYSKMETFMGDLAKSYPRGK